MMQSMPLGRRAPRATGPIAGHAYRRGLRCTDTGGSPAAWSPCRRRSLGRRSRCCRGRGGSPRGSPALPLARLRSVARLHHRWSGRAILFPTSSSARARGTGAAPGFVLWGRAEVIPGRLRDPAAALPAARDRAHPATAGADSRGARLLPTVPGHRGRRHRPPPHRGGPGGDRLPARLERRDQRSYAQAPGDPAHTGMFSADGRCSERATRWRSSRGS